MSGARGGSSSNAAAQGELSSIPAEAIELVRSVREIVDRPAQEIYLALQECHMDPNDAVTRLLSQDSFHEVKSRKEKKKETKETSDSRLRNVNTISSRGGRGGAYRYDGRSGSTQFSSYDPGNSYSKPVYKKENESVDLSTSSTPAYGMRDTTLNRQRLPFSTSGISESKTHTTDTFDGISSPSQSSPGYQTARGPPPGQVSMANIVKMGGRKAHGTPNISTDYSQHALKPGAPGESKHNASHPISSAPPPQEVPRGLEAFHEPSFEVSESIQEAGHPVSDQTSHSEWDVRDQPSSRGASLLEPAASGEVFADPSTSPNSDRTKLHLDSRSDEVQEPERDVPAEYNDQSYIGSASASGGEIHEDNSFKNVGSYPHQRQTSEHQEGDGGSSQLDIPNYSVSSVDVGKEVSNAAEKLLQLSLKEEQGVRSTEVNPTAVIPNHPEILTAECLQLSFGSFGSVAPDSYVSNSTKTESEETSVAVNTTSSDQEEMGAFKYFIDKHLGSPSDENAAPRTTADAGSYDSSTQPEVTNHNTGETIRGQEYNFQTSVPGYMLDSNLQSNAAFHYEQTNPQMHNISHLSNVMRTYSNSLQGNPLIRPGQQELQQAYANSLQGNLLFPSGQPGRESSDLTYPSFLSTQPVPTKYSTAISSMPELANMTGYPFLPQGYAYLPPAYQQAYAASSTYPSQATAPQNAGMKYTLPPYKSSVPTSSIPQNASAYGGFGSSANIPEGYTLDPSANIRGSFTLNPSATSGSTGIGYDDVMSSQYKESNNFLPNQQGPGSRTASALPSSAYYNFQGQGQQHSAFQHIQPPPQHYGNLGYQNFYHSQAGVFRQPQQQSQNEDILGGFQGQPSKQSNQMWQQPY